eukprot:1154277-Pelagomonas_calceolata.AAC.1
MRKGKLAMGPVKTVVRVSLDCWKAGSLFVLDSKGVGCWSCQHSPLLLLCSLGVLPRRPWLALPGKRLYP